MQALDSSKNYVTNRKHGITNSTCHGWVNNQMPINFVDLSYVQEFIANLLVFAIHWKL